MRRGVEDLAHPPTLRATCVGLCIRPSSKAPGEEDSERERTQGSQNHQRNAAHKDYARPPAQHQGSGLSPEAMTVMQPELLKGVQYLTEASSRLMMAKERVMGPIWLKMTPIWTMPCKTPSTVKGQIPGHLPDQVHHRETKALL